MQKVKTCIPQNRTLLKGSKFSERFKEKEDIKNRNHQGGLGPEGDLTTDTCHKRPNMHKSKNHKGTPNVPFDQNKSGYACFGSTLATTPMQSGIESMIQSRFYIFTPTNRYQLKESFRLPGKTRCRRVIAILSGRPRSIPGGIHAASSLKS